MEKIDVDINFKKFELFESFKFECMSLNDILPYTRLALIKFKELFPSAPILIVSDYDYKWGWVWALWIMIIQ